MNLKKTLFALITLWLPLAAIAQERMNVCFDEGVELVCAVWRLAGAKEYNRCTVPAYAESLDRQCGGFKSHQAVELARRYHRNGTGYDAVAEFGTMLSLHEGRVEMNPAKANTLDYRWSDDMIQEFLPALNDFYRESGFHKWYVGTDSIRTAALTAFQRVADQVETEWFDTFFHHSEAAFHITLSLLVGPNNYGISSRLTNGQVLLCPVIGSAIYDEGEIRFDCQTVLPMVIHEFCHAYCNPLVDAHYAEMEPTLTQVYTYSKGILSSQAYTTPKIMMYETLVRASVIRYLQQHPLEGVPDLQELIKQEETRGFTLTETTERALADYERHEALSGELSSFMPELIQAINGFSIKRYAKKQRAEKKAADKQRVHYRCNIRNGAKRVAVGDITLAITFDAPMQATIAIGETDQELPEYKGHTWSEDQRTLSIRFTTQPATTYGLRIIGDDFISLEGRPAVESEIHFTTRKAD